MLKVFEQLKSKDERAIKEYGLSSSILMEMAAKGIAEKIIDLAYSKESFYQDLLDGSISRIPKKKTVLLVCGSSDNGGDGLALSRLLQDYFSVITFLPHPAKSEMCVLQKKRLDLLGIEVKRELELGQASCDILVDAVFGTGFKGEMRSEYLTLLQKMNQIEAVKIALDVPSGLDILGSPSSNCFKADITICIGALRAQLYSSLAKDYVGEIVLKRLPLPASKYEGDANLFLMEKTDMKLPYRTIQNVHKGTFGHVVVVQGDKKGACKLVAEAALNFGAGLVSVVAESVQHGISDLMESSSIPPRISCLAIGSGLGKKNLEVFNKFFLYISGHPNVLLVLDADIFYYDEISAILQQKRGVVCTPHPKEFQSLLKIVMGIDLSIDKIRLRKLELIRAFCQKYPHVVLLLKDCNTFIGCEKNIFINSKGCAALAKAGMGDVLAGLIASLLAQGYTPLQASITGSLAHAFAARFAPSSYSLTASKLIEYIGRVGLESESHF